MGQNSRIKKRLVIIAVAVTAILLLSILIFGLLHRDYTGRALPVVRNRQTQEFSQEVLYEHLKDFDMLGNGVILSTSGDPWIDVYLDSSIPGQSLVIDIYDLRAEGKSVEQTTIQIFYALPGYGHAEINSVHEVLTNGTNLIRLPYGYYYALRLDLAQSLGISMIVNSVVFSNHYVLQNDFWLSYSLLVILCIALVVSTGFIIAEKRKEHLRKRNNPSSDQTEKEKQTFPTKLKILYYTAASLIPNIFLFFLYEQNRALNHIIFTHVLILAGIFSFVGLVLFFMLRRVLRGFEASLVISALFWTAFWIFRSIYSVFQHLVNFATYAVLLSTLIVAIVALIAVLMRFQIHLTIMRVFLPFIFSGLFLFNFVPIIYNEVGGNWDDIPHELEWEEATTEFNIKRDFFVDPTLPHPDIYWFHMDGMLSLEVHEHFFGDYQGELREQLNTRGFKIYPYAELNALCTTYGIVALTSPYLYESYLRDCFTGTLSQLKYVDGLLGNVWIMHVHHERLANDGFNLFEDMIPYIELIAALASIGYEIVDFAFTMDLARVRGMPVRDNILNRFLLSDLPELLNRTTPLLFSHSEINESVATVVGNIHDNEAAPRFVWKHESRLHAWQWYMQHPYFSEHEGTRHYDRLYQIAFEYAVHDMLQQIDAIIRRNPNAVIVLQSDHGFHVDSTQRQLLDDGHSKEEVLDLAVSVFSAVRIPEKWVAGGLSEPLHPLDITRFIVNNFVGENYEMLFYRQE